MRFFPVNEMQLGENKVILSVRSGTKLKVIKKTITVECYQYFGLCNLSGRCTFIIINKQYTLFRHHDI